MTKAFITDKLYIKKKDATPALVRKYFEFYSYKENVCQRCPIYKDGGRHSDDCDSCPAFQGIHELWNIKHFKGKPYVGFPPAQPEFIAKALKLNLSIKDKRPEIPFSSKNVKFTQKLYTGKIVDGRKTVNQKQMVKDWFKKKTGIIQVPPRGGKTITSVCIGCKLQQKMIIIVDKHTLAQQFYDTIMGSKIRKAATNFREIEETTGKTRVKIIKKMSDFKGLDIAICNYQKFIRNKKAIRRIAKYINGKFSILILDEAHRAGALAFLRFIAGLDCRYRIALSATPIRKDGNDRLTRFYLGGVVAQSNTVAKIPQIQLVETGVYAKNPYKLWVYAMKYLSNNKERNQLIVRDVFKDLRDGHHSIIIPVDFVNHGKKLMGMINRQAEINNEKRDENWPEPMATFFTAAYKKSPEKMQKILSDVDRGKFKVLVAMRSMIKEGVDLQNPTMLYNIVPCSATKDAGSPLFYQLGNRICTWGADKKQPIIRVYLDGLGQSLGCLKSLWWNEIIPGLKSVPNKPAKYKIEESEYKRIMDVVRTREYIPENSPGERIYSKQIIKTKTKVNIQRGFSSFMGT